MADIHLRPATLSAASRRASCDRKNPTRARPARSAPRLATRAEAVRWTLQPLASQLELTDSAPARATFMSARPAADASAAVARAPASTMPAPSILALMRDV